MPKKKDAYARRKDAARAKIVEMGRQGRNIGGVGFVADPARRARAAVGLRFFCEAYQFATYSLPWSPDHLKVIAKIEQAVLAGGLFAVAMPRGSGKTTLSESACIWAMANGHHEFVCLIGSDEGHAEAMLDSIKSEIADNDLLAEDYPEMCAPIAALEGIANRCSGQLYNDERTHVGWTAKEIVLPTLRPEGWLDREDHRQFVRADGLSLSSGGIIKVAGITGRIRGMKFKRADGRTVRPSLVIPDDPQTDESARSVSQCATRESILAGAILGLSGPGKKISGIMPCTVIRPGDMADSILDRQKHPDWNGERTRMVYSFPTNEKLWSEYGEIRAESLRINGDIREATEFYRLNRAAMDEGSAIAWPERFNPDELSALQHAMNLRLRDEAAFFAEYQNEPLPVEDERAELTADQIAAKLNSHKAGVVPIDASHLTAFIDVQGSLLFWTVCAWTEDFTGYVLGYGAWPDQQRPYFTLREARDTIGTATKIGSLEGSIYAALERLTGELLGREWKREDGAALRIERCLIDANWGASTDVVYQFCRQSSFSSVLLPSHGRFVGASSPSFDQYRKKPGERVGHNWRIPNVHGTRAVRHLVYDANFWKSFTHARLAQPMGEKGCLSLFGDKPGAHRLYAEHITAEYPVRTEARGRVVDEWKSRAARPDNHWLDCTVGCAVGASLQGCALAGVSHSPAALKSRRVSFAEMQQRRRGA